MSIIFHLNVLRHYCVSRFNRWRAGLVGPKFVLGVKAKTHTARGKPMAMLHFFFFKSTTKLKFRRGSIYIYIYIYISLPLQSSSSSPKKNNSASSLWGKKIIAVFFFLSFSLKEVTRMVIWQVLYMHCF